MMRSLWRLLSEGLGAKRWPAAAPPQAPLGFETLEPRVLLSAKLGGIAAPPLAAVPDDAFEENDTRATAFDLGTVLGKLTRSNLVQNDDDWYKFTLSGPGSLKDYAKVTFQHSKGDIDLELYNAAGQLLQRSDSLSNTEIVSLYGLSAGVPYYLRVSGFLGSMNPKYGATIVASGLDDRFGLNDTFAQATNLKTLTRPVNLADLVLRDHDWFKFTQTGTGTNASSIAALFDGTAANLNLRLFNSAGTEIASSTGAGNTEFISLNGIGPGTYYVQVELASGTGVQYDLSIAPGNGINGEHTLFLNFDGANISRANLDAWSNNQADWLANIYGDFDPDANGIVVESFFDDRPLQREAIIAGLIKKVMADLAPFGMQVVRHFGLAVEGIKATTIFLGDATIAHPHIACDIDFGNVNLTDIAFVGDGARAADGLPYVYTEWRGSVNNTATTLADVTLHEAGHTFGLYHVVSGGVAETMGWRYNQPFSKWVTDTAFKNQFFPVLPGHGPNMLQNSFQYMAGVFGLANRISAEPVGNGVVWLDDTVPAGSSVLAGLLQPSELHHAGDPAVLSALDITALTDDTSAVRRKRF